MTGLRVVAGHVIQYPLSPSRWLDGKSCGFK